MHSGSSIVVLIYIKFPLKGPSYSIGNLISQKFITVQSWQHLSLCSCVAIRQRLKLDHSFSHWLEQTPLLEKRIERDKTGKGHVLFYAVITRKVRQHITVAIRKPS